MNPRPTLHLVLKHHWFDKIESLQKGNEYRQCSDHWNKVFLYDGTGQYKVKIKGKLYPANEVVIEFRRGYGSNAKRIRRGIVKLVKRKVTQLESDHARDHDFPAGTEVYHITLGILREEVVRPMIELDGRLYMPRFVGSDLKVENGKIVMRLTGKMLTVAAEIQSILQKQHPGSAKYRQGVVYLFNGMFEPVDVQAELQKAHDKLVG